MIWLEQLVDYCVFFIAFFGNFFILILLYVNRKRWKSMDIYVYSLAIFDFIYTLGIPVRIYVRWKDGHWPFGTLSKYASFEFLLSFFWGRNMKIQCIKKERKKELISLLNNKQATWTNNEIRAIFFVKLPNKLLTTMTW